MSIASARTAIARKGARVSYQVIPDPTPDSAQPWKAIATALPAPVDVFIVFTDATSRDSQGMSAEYERGTDVLTGNKKGLMANHPTITPRVNDRITHANGTVYVVTKIKDVSPDGTPILWKLELSK